MSQETYQTLNTRTLIGFTAPEHGRGKAWHYRASAQGAESNHYPHDVPVADVIRRLFNFRHAEGTVETTFGDTHIVDPTRKAISRPPCAFGPEDPGAILGLFSTSWRYHAFDEWLLARVADIADSELRVASAGLLREGGLAWVAFEVPESITTPEGVTFRPFLTAATSVNGKLATTYGRGAQLSVCDNTLDIALTEASNNGSQVKIKHSANSLGALADLRDRLGIIYQTAEAFAAEVAELTSQTVTDAQWARIVDEIAPLPVPGQDKTSRGLTMASNKRDALNTLWNSDERVTLWKGTSFGVVQAVNTYEHHLKGVARADRPERNMERMVTGDFGKVDQNTLSVLRKVRALV